jgi:type VI protein secretion system component Hcp
MAEANRRPKRGRLGVEPLEGRELLSAFSFITFDPTSHGPLEKGEILVSNQEAFAVKSLIQNPTSKEITLTGATHAGGSELVEFAFDKETFKSITIDMPKSMSATNGVTKGKISPQLYEEYRLKGASILNISFSNSSEAREIELITFNYANIQVVTTKRRAASSLVTPASGWDASSGN